MALQHVFRSSLESVKYLMPNGKELIFRFHQFLTDVEAEVTQLKEEIAGKHPYLSYEGEQDIYVKSPNEVIEALVNKEVERRLAALNPSNDMGKSEQGKLMAANSSNIAEAAAGGTGLNLAALRATLANKPIEAPVAVQEAVVSLTEKKD